MPPLFAPLPIVQAPQRRAVLAGGASLAAGAALWPGLAAGQGGAGGPSAGPTVGSATAPGTAARPASAAPRPLHILILGGTGFTGPHQVRYALARGHKVTLFNRGRRPKEWPASVEELTGDRDTRDYAALKGRRFDVCIDNPTSVPFWVRDAAAVLAGQVGHYVFISTISVYADDSAAHQDETAPRAAYTGPDAMAETNASLRQNMALYGPLKAASEDEARRRFPGITTVIRPGLIVGPGDETDRFTYWPLRLQRGGRVLVPPLADPVKFIDARDLAEWTIRMAEQRSFGDFNAFGPAGELSMGAMLREIDGVTGGRATLVEATPRFLEDNRVQPWSDLPVWVPGQGETAGMHRRSNARAVAAGLTFRPVARTTADLLAWWATLDEKRRATPRAGMKPEREAELLAKL
jgi:2'-hydroxyisoflavone reductase